MPGDAADKGEKVIVHHDGCRHATPDATRVCPKCRAVLVLGSAIGHAVLRVCPSDLCALRSRGVWFAVVEG